MTHKRASSLLAVAVAAAALFATVLASPASAAIRHIDGTVVAKNAKNRSFKLSTESGTLRIRVDRATVFERIAGFGGLHKCLAIEVDARTTRNGLLAKQIETRGGRGGGDDHGGDDHGGDDHGGDDHGGDDHGRGGSDDGPNHT